MQIFFDDRQCLHNPARELHNGDWTDYYESADRARKIAGTVGAATAPADFGEGPIAAVHAPEYLHFLKTAMTRWREAGRSGDAIGYVWPIVRRRALEFGRIDAELGQYSMDASTPISDSTWEAAYWNAQCAVAAAHTVLSGEKSAFALCRPPGHHAGRDYLGGYCYLNNVAIAAQHALDQGRSRVAILDVDYHHGNGTQDIFWRRGNVLFASLHADPRTDFPFYWGHADERGEGDGAGATLNYPLPRGTTIEPYRSALSQALKKIEASAPELLLVSFGADTFALDPISHFELQREDYAVIGRDIAALGLPSVIVMEGGYDLDALGDNTTEFLGAF
ncbi:histone deacetylase family protein [Erythrobacter rubeus]|uniref:Histone deacetylase family protein n=1 Tax=Erythrobacter rubeus TaxID=2760803 RepID=A0ABR8KNH9_9SPHN|nr:histone deacetylase family protein [Erythrobacter rubeus]MBD2842170.1 histone deacetylase family protein [Erythrobacter rubeus]